MPNKWGFLFGKFLELNEEEKQELGIGNSAEDGKSETQQEPLNQ
ncbi:MAG TPA: hypothetical protein VMV84_06490 [Dehalococcoidales bacterium]|nr:hypothetical protein [Dehalococcoidales bacterium]